MSERYQKLFALNPNLYFEGSPVIISAGALLLDTETNQVLAQLKFFNLDHKRIRSLKVHIASLDAENNRLGTDFEFTYREVYAESGSYFGAQTPVYLPVPNTRKYAVSVEEVVFEDGTAVSPPNAKWHWKPLPPDADIPAIMAMFAPKPKRIGLLIGLLSALLVAVLVAVFAFALPAKKFDDMTDAYDDAVYLMESGSYADAYDALMDPDLTSYKRIDEIDTTGRIALIREAEATDWSGSSYTATLKKVEALKTSDVYLQKLIFYKFPIFNAYSQMNNGSFTDAYTTFVSVDKSGAHYQNPIVSAVHMAEATDWDDRNYHNITEFVGTVAVLDSQAVNMFSAKFDFVASALSLNGKWVYAGIGIDIEDETYVTAFDKGYWTYTFSNGSVTEWWNFSTTYYHDMYVKLGSDNEYTLFIGSQTPTSSKFEMVFPPETDSDSMSIADVNDYYSWLLLFERA